MPEPFDPDSIAADLKQDRDLVHRLASEAGVVVENFLPGALARARHEYVHSVLAPLGKRAPSWLHEGLAQVFERRSAAQAMLRVRASEPLPFASLSQSFVATKSGDMARRQYDTALAFVTWLKDGARSAGFRAAMSSLFDDKSLEDAFKIGYDAELADLYAAFQKSLAR